jgi:hypothetical protein
LPAEIALLNIQHKGEEIYGVLILSAFIQISSYPEEFFECREMITFSVSLVVIVLNIILEKWQFVVKFK